MKINKKSALSLAVFFLKGSMRYFIICILSGIILSICETMIPQLIRFIVDSVIGSAPATLRPLKNAEQLAVLMRSNMLMCAIAPAALGLLAAILRYTTNQFNSKAGETMVENMRNAMFAHIEALPKSWLQNNSTGDIIQRCTSDINRIKEFFQEQFVSVFKLVLTIILSIIAMFSMNRRLCIVVLVISPLIIIYSVVFHNYIKKGFIRCADSEDDLSTIAQENLSGVRVVRAFGREKYESERFRKQNDEVVRRWIEVCRSLTVYWTIGDCLACIQAMLIVCFGAVLCVSGNLSQGEFISFNVYNAMLIFPVRQLGRIISEMSKAGVAVERISEVLNASPETDSDEAIKTEISGDIVFDNVSFSYDGKENVLKNVSFTIPEGKSFGILGATGSGKSSLLQLLCRLYAPTEGKITIGGKNIDGFTLKTIRSNIGIVLQEPYLFSRSIGENIGITGADFAHIEEAAETACIAGDISKFSGGYETQVGERGVTISGGQKQRVAIARMLTRKTPIMIFDDSLSAVDTNTDEQIRRAIRDKLCGTTTIIVSHRITTLLSCDYILVLDKGCAIQYGSPSQLLSENGIFKHVYELQMAVGEEEMNERQ